MQNSVKAIPFAKGATKTAITATGMTGTAIGAYHVKNLVTDATDNQILGICSGVATILLGSVLTVAACSAVDRAFSQSTPPLVIDVASDAQMFIKEPAFDLDDLEGT